jgi:hypothetical protein
MLICTSYFIDKISGKCYNKLAYESEVIMEAIHQVIDGRILNQVISLPKPLQEVMVEIIIKPAATKSKLTMTRSELRARLRGSHTESLSGALRANTDMTLDELRAERRMVTLIG